MDDNIYYQEGLQQARRVQDHIAKGMSLEEALQCERCLHPAQARKLLDEAQQRGVMDDVYTPYLTAYIRCWD